MVDYEFRGQIIGTLYAQRINAVTAEDIRRAAGKYYDAVQLQIVAVGNAAKIKDALAKYGAVEMFDTGWKRS